MIKTLLIANRGEIACRVIATARRLGIRTIAVFSDADRDARHVALADEAHYIGASPARESYLNAQAIIAAARVHGADAIHPGYGFLSERLDLVEGCEKAGIVFVGPSAGAIEKMGSKIESKRLARAAGVAGVPGYDGDAQDDISLLRAAEEVGFPLLIKASAGGGGKGMRRVDEPKAFQQELDLARREARASFGDDRILIERFIWRPRHIEVQLAGDKHGNLVHLYERECSIQRGYQKVVEEAPAAFLPQAVRGRLLADAVTLGRAIRYDSLGTVEFIVDADTHEAFFLEMNTRLQVEHPVTEMITGLDLVELQLRIASGEALSLAQGDIPQNGAAIEVRLNAEDPSKGYRPGLGRVLCYREPLHQGVRVDTGIRSGTEVTPYYDSLLAKVIAAGNDRAQAAQRMIKALDDFVIMGIATNQRFLRDILAAPAFLDAPLTTNFITEVFPLGWQPDGAQEVLESAVAAALWVDQVVVSAPEPWSSLKGFRVTARAGRSGKSTVLLTTPDGVAEEIVVSYTRHGFSARVREQDFAFELLRVDDGVDVLHAGRKLRFSAIVEKRRVGLARDGRSVVFSATTVVVGASGSCASSAAGGKVMAPMPGVVTELKVAIGDIVKVGDPVAVMEAMKLVMPLLAAAGGKVAQIKAMVGQSVAAGSVLIEIDLPG